jgi:hypothetical protein
VGNLVVLPVLLALVAPWICSGCHAGEKPVQHTFPALPAQEQV